MVLVGFEVGRGRSVLCFSDGLKDGDGCNVLMKKRRRR